MDVVHPPDVEAPVGHVGALRSIRRRVRAVRAALVAIATLLPERFAGVQPTLGAFREALGGGAVLVRLRELAERYVGLLRRRAHARKETGSNLPDGIAMRHLVDSHDNDEDLF